MSLKWVVEKSNRIILLQAIQIEKKIDNSGHLINYLSYECIGSLHPFSILAITKILSKWYGKNRQVQQYRYVSIKSHPRD